MFALANAVGSAPSNRCEIAAPANAAEQARVGRKRRGIKAAPRVRFHSAALGPPVAGNAACRIGRSAVAHARLLRPYLLEVWYSCGLHRVLSTTGDEGSQIAQA